jgi:hypothetical protein
LLTRWENLQRPINQGRIDGVQRIPEAKPMLRCHGFTALVKLCKQRFVERTRLLLVHPRQSRASDSTRAQVVPAPVLCLGIGNDVAKTVAPGQLAHRQSHKLRPARGLAKAAADVMPLSQTLELMSRYQFQPLRKHSVMMCQGLVTPIDTVRWWYFTMYQSEKTKPFLFPFMGQQWV